MPDPGTTESPLGIGTGARARFGYKLARQNAEHGFALLFHSALMEDCHAIS